MEEGRTEPLLIKEERLEEESDPLGELKIREERVVDCVLDGDVVDVEGKPANCAEELAEPPGNAHGMWEVGGLEAVLGAEPKPKGPRCEAASEPRPERLSGLFSEYVMYEGPDQPRTFFPRGDGEGAADDPYRSGPESGGPMAHPVLLPSTEDTVALSSLGPLDWKPEPALITAKMGLLHPQLTVRENPEPNSDTLPLGINGCSYTASQGSGAHGRAGGREKRFFCSFCGKGFSFPKQVEIHQRVHTGEKPFSCTQCRQRFSHSGNLKRHQRVHTGEKPFSCTLCEKRFSHLHQLKMHQRIHSGERPFACTYCGKRFSERSYLRIHQQRSHTGVFTVR
ncbi:hypothetical protein JZ751_016373 [Albula glossodonta]|uniref:C2H2-type domain-containing protein n=1 Tax=Albula glossodonta TaxID=121402 RepID=A0A8T2NY62_9TELE|nr:hypothetical protein JZ751_016373 [Albula glossodonta]